MKMQDRKIYSYINNDKLEMEKLIKDYTNYISTIIMNSCINLSTEDIEELVLDVFLTVWKNKNKLDINNGMSAYIGGITRNLIKKKFRDKRVNDNILDYEQKLIDLTNIDLEISQKEENQIVFEELEKMKEEDRNIFIEYYYAEKNIEEISFIFNMSKAKVKSKLFRIRKKLKKRLEEKGYGSNG